jgi:4-amino-4-deoxy-L-arabinose transferase-like glycosyltransferase
MRLRALIGLPGILALALVARIAAIVASPDFRPIFDAADFDRHAASIAAGNGYPPPQLGLEGPSAFRPPLYPVALAVVHKLGGGWTAGRVLGALLGTLAVALVFLIAERLWDHRVALVAALIAAVFPPLVFLSASLLSEQLFLPLVLASVLGVLVYRDTGAWRWAVAAGVLCGLAILARTSGAPYVLALAVGAWALRPRFSRAALVPPLVVLLATAVTVAPWVVRNTLVFDRFAGLGTGAGYALAGTYNAESRARGDHPGEPFSPNVLRTFRDVFAQRDLDEDQFIGKLNDRATDYIADHPGYVVETMAWNVLRVFEVERRGSFGTDFATQEVQALGVGRLDSPIVFLGSLYLVVALALVGVAAQLGLLPSRRAPPFVWWVPVLLLVPALAIYGLPRYRAPVDPFLVMLAAVALVALRDRFRRAEAA